MGSARSLRGPSNNCCFVIKRRASSFLKLAFRLHAGLSRCFLVRDVFEEGGWSSIYRVLACKESQRQLPSSNCEHGWLFRASASSLLLACSDSQDCSVVGVVVYRTNETFLFACFVRFTLDEVQPSFCTRAKRIRAMTDERQVRLAIYRFFLPVVA